MPTIRVIDFAGNELDSATVNDGDFFADAVMKNWPDGWVGMTPLVLLPDGEMATDEEALSVPMDEGEEWTVQLLPQLETVFLGLKLYQWALLAISLASAYMTSRIPNVQGRNTYEWEDSDRPQFYSGQQNSVQPGRRIPDIFGTMRTYPDLMSAPAIDYNGNVQTIRELYVVSRGDVDVSEPKFHDEEYNQVPGTDIRVYKPGEKWPSDFPIMRQNAAVGNIELPAENEAINYGSTYIISANGYIQVEQDGYWDEFEGSVGAAFMMTGVNVKNRGPRQVVSVTNNGRRLNVNPAFTVNETIVGGAVTFQGLSYISLLSNGTPRTYNIQWELRNDSSYSENDIGYLASWYARSTTPAIAPFPSNGHLIPVNAWDDFATNITTDNRFYGKHGLNFDGLPTGNHNFVQFTNADKIYVPDIPGSGYASAAFNVPGRSNEAWLDFEFATGLYSQESGNAPQARSVWVRIYHRKQGSTGGWGESGVKFTDKTRSPRRFTYKLMLSSVDEWEVYVERVTPMVLETESKVVVDAVQWIGLSSRQDTPELNSDTLNCTLVDVTLRSQSLAQAGQNRRFNVLARRNLTSYRGSGARYHHTIADAILHTLYDMGNIARKNVDEDTLWAIQDSFEFTNDGRFDAKIDQTMTVEDQVSLIASAGRITVFRRGSTFYFSRMKAGLIPTTLINARNKEQPENRSFNFSQTNDPDAIILRYQNRLDDYREATYQYPEGVDPYNAEEQTIMGLTDPGSVARMTQYMWNRGKYEKDTVFIPMLDEGTLLAPGDVISVTDSLSENAPVEGEIVSVSGTSFTFDQPIPAGTYMASVRDKYGDLHETGQVNIAAESNVQSIAAWSGLTMPSATNAPTTGLLYTFAEIQYEHRDEYYVTRVQPSREGGVGVDAVLYRQETYAGDTASSFQNTAKRVDSFKASGRPTATINTSDNPLPTMNMATVETKT